MRARLTLLILVLACGVVPTSGRALPALPVWTIQGLTWDDGGGGSGAFTYDAISNAYSSVAITTTAGSVRSGAAYAFAQPLSNATTLLVTTVSPGSDETGLPAMVLFFNAPLTNAGGTTPLLTTTEEVTCPNPTCSSAPPSAVRFATAGSVTTTAVPTMPPWAVLGLGTALVMGAAWILRRKRADPQITA